MTSATLEQKHIKMALFSLQWRGTTESFPMLHQGCGGLLLRIQEINGVKLWRRAYARSRIFSKRKAWALLHSDSMTSTRKCLFQKSFPTSELGAQVGLGGGGRIDKFCGARYSRESALTGRLLPAAREASYLFSFSVSNYLLSAWYQRDTGKYERRLCVPVEVFAFSPIL